MNSREVVDQIRGWAAIAKVQPRIVKDGLLPVWFGDQGCLMFSDIPNDRILRWMPEGLMTFRRPANYTNGHTRDLQGRLVRCEHGTRRVTRTE